MAGSVDQRPGQAVAGERLRTDVDGEGPADVLRDEGQEHPHGHRHVPGEPARSTGCVPSRTWLWHGPPVVCISRWEVSADRRDGEWAVDSLPPGSDGRPIART